MRSWLAALLLSGNMLFGCSSSGAEEQPPSCPAEYQAQGNACVARVDVCPEGELPRIGGGCTPVGARVCGEGFVANASSGCDVVLPAAACAKGTLAIPGETKCHPVAECGAGTWGAIPVDATTVYVDASYTGSDADGSLSHPFPTVQRGIDAAKSDGIVAVAAGRYVEDVRIARPVRLHGVCPDKVGIAGVSADFAVDVTANAELHALAITGPDVALGVYQSKVVAERVWIHDATDRGIDVEDGSAPAELILRDSLVEGSGQIGVFSQGARVRIERSVVRDTRAAKKGVVTEGILARATPETKRRSELFVSRSVVSGNATWGILVNSSTGVVEDSFVTDTRGIDGNPAGAINAHDLEAGVPTPHTELTVRRSLVTKAFGVGIDTLHTEVVLEDVTVGAMDGQQPGGIALEESNGTVTGVTVQDIAGLGVAISGGHVDVRRALVRRIDPAGDGTGGVGVFIRGSLVDDSSRSSLSESVIVDTHSVGVVMWGGTGSLRDSFIGRIAPDVSGQFGDGIAAVAGVTTTGRVISSSLEVQRVVVRDVARAGIASFAAKTTVQGSLICAAIDMQVVESFGDPEGGVIAAPTRIADLGANSCGCDRPHACRAQIGGLKPIPARPWD